jgi:dUTPase
MDMNIRVVNKYWYRLTEYCMKRPAGLDMKINIEKEIAVEPVGRAMIQEVLFEVDFLRETIRGTGGFGHTVKE